METRVDRDELPLVVIAGPTASGKTALAISLAKRWGGEIICADSRTVYRGMDIGTAKPTPEEQDGIPHWGLDLISPNERFSAADFQAYAQQKIDEIRARRHIPFLVGGTGLYIDAVIFGYEFGRVSDDSIRRRLEAMTIEQLHEYCKKNNIQLPQNDQNKRYLIRAIEQRGVNIQREASPLSTSIIVGIATDSEILRTRIEQRSEQLFQNGVVEEAIKLGKKYGWQHEAMTGNIYPLVRSYLENEMSMKEIEEKFTTLDWKLAKRQMTWFRRDPYIVWGARGEIEQYVSHRLASVHHL